MVFVYVLKATEHQPDYSRMRKLKTPLYSTQALSESRVSLFYELSELVLFTFTSSQVTSVQHTEIK